MIICESLAACVIQSSHPQPPISSPHAPLGVSFLATPLTIRVTAVSTLLLTESSSLGTSSLMRLLFPFPSSHHHPALLILSFWQMILTLCQPSLDPHSRLWLQAVQLVYPHCHMRSPTSPRRRRRPLPGRPWSPPPCSHARLPLQDSRRPPPAPSRPQLATRRPQPAPRRRRMLPPAVRRPPLAFTGLSAPSSTSTPGAHVLLPLLLLLLVLHPPCPRVLCPFPQW